MNTLALFGLCFAVCMAGALAVYWAVIRPAERRDRTARAQRIADINTRLRGMPAAPDDQPGTRLDWQDLCERIWSAPFDPQTRFDRLRHEINKAREEEA